MEGKANYQLSNMNDEEKQAGTLSYTIKEVGSLEEAQVIKSKIDEVIETAGGDVHQQALKVTP